VHTRLVQSTALPHPWPVGQGPQEVPPQSCPVSLPFFAPSVHAGAWQIPLTHTWLEQSVPAVQPLPVLQRGHAPPQSCPVSLPFFTPSVQLAGWHVELQTRLKQSTPALHAFVVPQRGQAPPPQSTSVSVPFFVPSVHRALVHTARSQKVLAQSADFWQAFPRGHG
jgi:hypothetical protein